MIQLASIVGLAKTILIILLVYTVFKYVMRLLAPLMIRSLAKRMANTFHQTPPRNPKKEGEVTNDKKTNQSQTNNNVGEYVDFEEID